MTSLFPQLSFIGWHKWIGLPYLLRADPRNGEGCDCLQLGKALYEEIGLAIPELVEEAWYSMTANRQWLDLYEVFNMATTEAEPLEPLSLVPFLTRSSFGLGFVVQDNLILTTNHRNGVQAIPCSALNEPTFWRPV